MRSLFLLLFFAGPLSAQSDFLKNDDVVWAAEIEQDWIVDLLSLENEQDSGVTTLKLLRTRHNDIWWSSAYLADLVFQAALDGHFPVYKDPSCLQPLNIFHAYPSRDTIVTFDPETYEEKLSIAFVEPWPLYDFKAWRLRQVLTYHKKSAGWSTTVQAIAPLITVKNSTGDSIGVRPLFWFRPDNERQNLSSDNIVWAKEMSNRQHATWVPINGGKVVKVTKGFTQPMAHQIQALGNDFERPFYNSGNQKILTQEDRRGLIAKTDTVVTFDSETYEEKISIVHNALNINSIRHVRLIQTWYWDENKHRLSICMDAVAPLIDVLDNEGNFRYQTPLYYRRQ